MAEIRNTDKPVLVLLHGWGVNQGVWHTLINDITPDVVVLCLDIPGFGLAQQLPSPYNFDAVLAALATQIPDNSIVCGWSLGGLLAIALAERYPVKVTKLGLIAATPCFLQHTDWPGMKPDVLEQFGQTLQRNLSQTISRFLAIQAMGSKHAKSDAAALKQAIAAFPQARAEALSAGLDFLRDQDLRQSFASLKQPVAACFGSLDSLVPAAVVAKLQRLKPHAALTILTKASHAPFISNREEFLAWLNNWLSLGKEPDT
jgi:pimeloyl-[acyl-carrier protein] methyl ester esterase